MIIAEQPQDEMACRLGADLEGSFEGMMAVYQDRLFAFALRLSGNPQDAEEIVQDAFVRSYRALSGYPAERIAGLALRPWLYKITLNVFRNRARRKIPPVDSLDAWAEDGIRPEPSAPEGDRPDAEAARAEQRRELGAYVAALPERYRAAVVLRHVAGLPYAEIAAVLGQAEGTAKSNVHRGIQQLRRSMPAQDSIER